MLRNTDREEDCSDPLVGDPGDPVITDRWKDVALAEIPLTLGDAETALFITLVKERGNWLMEGFCLDGYDGPCDPYSARQYSAIRRSEKAGA
jgi:hypothetical protein